MAVEYRCCETEFFVRILIVIGLVVFAGLMSGLTLGLMSMSLVDLEVLAYSGSPSHRKHAGMFIFANFKKLGSNFVYLLFISLFLQFLCINFIFPLFWILLILGSIFPYIKQLGFFFIVLAVQILSNCWTSLMCAISSSMENLIRKLRSLISSSVLYINSKDTASGKKTASIALHPTYLQCCFYGGKYILYQNCLDWLKVMKQLG